MANPMLCLSWLFLAVVSVCMGAEILIMPSSVYPVHRFTMRHLAEELLKRNHSVTWFEYGLQKVLRFVAITRYFPICPN